MRRCGHAPWTCCLTTAPKAPGVKFKDADLIGVPYRVTIGKRKFEQGLAEIFQRSTKQIQDVKLESVVSSLLETQRG
jgi:prolyl-tRNA synthetase